MSFEHPLKNIIPRIGSKLKSAKEKEPVNKSYSKNDGRRWIELVVRESEETVSLYYNNLGLTDEMLSQKNSVLDIGAGMADFAAHCKANKINDNVISLDLQQEDQPGIVDAQKMYFGEKIYEHVKNRTITGKMEEIPCEDESFDLIVGHTAMPGVYYHSDEIEEMKKGISNSFNEIMRVLRHGGEARMFPLTDDQEGESEIRKKFQHQAIKQKLSELQKTGICQVLTEEVIDPETKKITREKRIVIRKI